jgi:hypothetical protein
MRLLSRVSTVLLQVSIALSGAPVGETNDTVVLVPEWLAAAVARRPGPSCRSTE